MCGRFSLTTPEPQILARFGAKAPEGGIKVRYNIAPTQKVPVVLDSNPQQIELCKWGLTPEWTTHGLINARAETINDKPAFRDAHRCIVLADGFFEWKQSGGMKIPFRVTLADGGPFAFAGLWNTYAHEGEEEKAFTIVTTRANAEVSQIHDRMPVILQKGEEKIWLDDERGLPDALLRPYPGDMKVYAVSPLVNSVNFDSPAVVKPMTTLGDF